MEAAQGLAQIPAAEAQADNSTLNILLLGPTGVGKSTFINALCNYLAYPSLDEAVQGDVRSLIYSEFTYSYYDESDSLVTEKIVVGEPDVHEGGANRRPGSSCTQKCKAYTFPVGESQMIRLIDTPGIVDTRGADVDKENMKHILSFLSQYEVLHAVCVLLKPNEKRLTSSLKYAIVQLLEKLHKDASSNILFCFTNSRSENYGVGSTLPLIEEILKPTLKGDVVKLNINLKKRSTMYHFDSEAFRFQAMVKDGIKFSDKDMENYRQSWERSTEEAGRLIAHIVTLEPHRIKDTISLNRVRNMLESIQAPLRDISASIQNNLQEIRKVKTGLKESRGAISGHRGKLFRKEEYQVAEALPHPRTVCTEPSCRVKVCHDKCSPTETTVGVLECVEHNAVGLITSCADHVGAQVGAILPSKVFSFMSNILTSDSKFIRPFLGADSEAVFCSVLSLRTGLCKVCKCSNQKHIRESLEMRTATRMVEDENVRKVLEEATSEMEKKEKILNLLEEKEEKFKDENGVVMQAASLFAGFLEQNSIVVYHSAILEYLSEQLKQMKTDGDQNRVEELQGMLQSYNERVQTFKSFRHGGVNKVITEGDVNEELQKLFQLDPDGPNLKKWFDGVESEFTFEGVLAKGRGEAVYNAPVLPTDNAASTENGSRPTSLFARIAGVLALRPRVRDRNPGSQA